MSEPRHTSPGYKQYIGIAVILGVITLIELWAANLTAYRIPLLLLLTVAKAALVRSFSDRVAFSITIPYL